MEEKIMVWKAKMKEIHDEMQLELWGKHTDTGIPGLVASSALSLSHASQFLDIAAERMEGQSNE